MEQELTMEELIAKQLVVQEAPDITVSVPSNISLFTL